MKILKHIAIFQDFDENDNLKNQIENETYTLVPDYNEVIRNKITGEIINGEVGVGTDDEIENYEVIEKSKESTESID